MIWSEPLEKAVFIHRDNRFVARVLVDGAEMAVHVCNTGRLQELLPPGATVYLRRASNPARLYPYDLVAVEHGGFMVCIDSLMPNKLAAEYLPKVFPGARIVPEYTMGDSRFDFCVQAAGRRTFVEVKGVTLELGDGLAAFPDAPTVRGTKHLRELARLADEGYGAMVLFVIQRKGICRFSPYSENDPEFAAAYYSALAHGVEIRAVDCMVTEEGSCIDCEVEIDRTGCGL